MWNLSIYRHFSNLFVQPPMSFSHHAVIRGSNNQLIANQSIVMQIFILQGSASGTAVYVERNFPTTNANGLVSIEIGNGTVVSRNLAGIDWGSGPYFLKTEIDLNGGANYTLTSTSQLISVPYAIYAKVADKVKQENDPIFSSSIAK